MHPNKAKAKLAQGRIALGGQITFYAPPMVELFGALGFDWLFIDCEHGPMNESEIENLVRAAEAFDITPMARVPDGSAHTILRYLDRGIMGIIAPHIGTRAEAEALVKACRYYPEGLRSSAGAGRTNDYGLGRTREQYYEDSNREIMVIPLVESAEGVENIDAIASVPGVDAINLGPHDLNQSMGMPPAEEWQRAIDRVVQGTINAGKAASIGHVPIGDMESLRYYIDRGARMICVSPTDFIKAGAAEFKRQIEAVVPVKA